MRIIYYFGDFAMNKLVIFFPGAGYGMDCPFLYYTDFLYETLGFERLKLNYQHIIMNKTIPLDKRLVQLRTYIDSQLEPVNLNDYNEIVFVAKSIGCIEAGLVAEKYIVPALANSAFKFQKIFLTPVPEALSFCDPKCHVIIGTNDKAYSLFEPHCNTNNIPLLTVNGGDHSLEIVGKPLESIDALKNIVKHLSCDIFPHEAQDS